MSVIRQIGAVKISGQVVVAEVSGAVVKISGQYVNANITSSTIMMPVDIQGATIDVPVTGQVSITSGAGPVLAHISGETVIAKISGEKVTLSGEVVQTGIVSSDIMVPVDIQGQYVDLTLASGTGPIKIETPTGILAGYTQIASLSGGVAIGSAEVVSVLIKNLSGNASMWIGPTGVNSGAGLILLAGEAVSMDIDNLNKIYAYAETSGQYISWMGIVR